MSPRQRRLRRQTRRGRGAKRGVLVLLGMVVIGAFAGAAGVVGYIVTVASSAPSDIAVPCQDRTTGAMVS